MALSTGIGAAAPVAGGTADPSWTAPAMPSIVAAAPAASRRVVRIILNLLVVKAVAGRAIQHMARRRPSLGGPLPTATTSAWQSRMLVIGRVASGFNPWRR